MQYRTRRRVICARSHARTCVAHVLEGSVRTGGVQDSRQHSTDLTRAMTLTLARTYDRDLADVFAIRSEIAKKLPSSFRPKFPPKKEAVVEAKPTKDMVAYDLS